MTRSLLDVSKLANNEQFQTRIGVAYKSIAKSYLINKESQNVSEINYAQSVIRMSYTEFANLASIIALDENVDLVSPTDEQIIQAVKDLWIDVSGIIGTGASVAQLPQEIRLAHAKPLVENPPPEQRN